MLQWGYRGVCLVLVLGFIMLGDTVLCGAAEPPTIEETGPHGEAVDGDSGVDEFASGTDARSRVARP